MIRRRLRAGQFTPVPGKMKALSESGAALQNKKGVEGVVPAAAAAAAPAKPYCWDSKLKEEWG
jgi:hypothetical protein